MASKIPYSTTSSVTLHVTPTSAFTAALAQFDTSKLMNTLRVPVEVREIRVSVETRPLSAANVRSIEASTLVQLEGKFGEHYITDGPIFYSVMAPYRLVSDPMDAYPIANIQTAQFTVRRIILPKPLYVAPGVGFSFTAMIVNSSFVSGIHTDFDVVVYVSLLGRYLGSDAKPQFNYVPMISDVLLTQSNLISTEVDFRNPLSKPLQVHRIVAAAPLRFVSVGPVTSGESLLNALDLRLPIKDSTVEMRFPNGDLACEDPVDLLRSLFGPMRTWPASFEMPANERIVAKISANTSQAADPIVGYEFGLFGTRPEVIP